MTVFAAASLTSSFTEIARLFEQANPGVDVRLSFGGSSDLVQQIRTGAPADVFASADEATMKDLGRDAVEPRDFAANTLRIAVPPGNPAGIRTLRDLTRRDVKVVVCAPEVPCGAATQKVATKAGLRLRPVSQEQAVTDVLGKVAAGEADAGLVYVTDVRSAGRSVEGIDFRESADVVNTYPIARLRDAREQRTAQRFVDFVTGDRGRAVLDDAGFARP